MTKPIITNLENCIEDIRQAALDQDPGPEDILDYNLLRGRLHAARSRVPKLYLDAAYEPFVAKLDELGEREFNKMLVDDPTREGAAGLMLDIAQAILQRSENGEAKAVPAFQEVVSDLYDGFLSAEDRAGVLPPDNETIPPMVKYGAPDSGPYTWPVDATESFGLKVGVVSLPPANASKGLLAWPALGHETGGHDILHADNGLLDQTSRAVRDALHADPSTNSLARYWATRIDETASDVLGILNMGPAAGIGLLGLFRGLNAAFGGPATLRNEGPADDVHPASLLRGFLAAATVRQLEFSNAQAWGDLIEEETLKDVSTIIIEDQKIDVKVAKRSAEMVAEVLVSQPMHSLEDHAFGDVQNWRDEDEERVAELRKALELAGTPALALTDGFYAAHLVAATTMSALAQATNLRLLQARMIETLRLMHQKNPSFGALRIRHPGNLVRHRTYVPFTPSTAVTAVPMITESPAKLQRKRA